MVFISLLISFSFISRFKSFNNNIFNQLIHKIYPELQKCKHQEDQSREAPRNKRDQQPATLTTLHPSWNSKEDVKLPSQRSSTMLK